LTTVIVQRQHVFIPLVFVKQLPSDFKVGTANRIEDTSIDLLLATARVPSIPFIYCAFITIFFSKRRVRGHFPERQKL